MFRFGSRSKSKLEGVHEDLVKLCYKALEYSDVDFGITQGMRTEEQQKELVNKGASQTMNSRHLTGHAVDIICYVGGKGSWHWPLYVKVYEAFRKASLEMNIPLEWGGNWVTIKDGPHFQLPWTYYPVEEDKIC